MTGTSEAGKKRTLAAAVVLATAAVWISPEYLLAADAVHWLTGEPLAAQLARPVTISWTDMPLRDGLTGLSRSQRVAIVLDRRVDPGQEIDLSVDQLPLASALDGLARQLELEQTVIGPVVYIGPPAAAANLRTLVALFEQQSATLPSAVQRRLAKKRPWQWKQLTTPGTLLDELASEGQIDLPDRQRIPHDLWAEAQLPPLSLIESLLLVTIQFDLTCELTEGAVVRFLPIPERAEIRREYPGGRDAQRLAERLRTELPDCRVEADNGKVVVYGRIEDHERLRGDRPTAQAAVVAEAERVYTLMVQDAPLGALLEQLERRLSLDINFDEATLQRAGVELTRRVSFDVQKATIDELLKAALRPAGLKHRRRGNTVEVLLDGR
jgi:hypothetical protein